MIRFFRLISAVLGIWSLPLMAYEIECCNDDCIVECYDLTQPCRSKEPCNWEIYFGGAVFEAMRQIDSHTIGLGELFAFDGGKRHVDGAWGGTIIGLTYRNPCGVYFNAEFDWATGELNRKRCVDHFHAKQVNELITDIKIGYQLSNGCFSFIPLAGIGNWIESYEVSRGSKFRYCSWYGIIGAKADWLSNDYLSIGIDAELFIPFHTRLKINQFSSHINLDNGWGGKIELPCKFDLSSACVRGFCITLAPFYRAIEWNRSRFFTCDIETFRAPKIMLQDYGAKFYLSLCF